MTTPIERLGETFANRSRAGQAALIPYVTAGFPSLEETAELLVGLVGAGADVLELGVPFSDPVADGPTIQASSFRALQAGATLRRCLDVLRAFRRDHATPVVLFTYLNPVLRFGVGGFLSAARDAGADGLLVTDLPVGADPGLEARIDDAGLALIRLAAPTTTPERLDAIAATARGFVYYISRTGVTGARQSVRDGLAAEVRAVRARVGLPVAVGFGISTPAQAAEVASVADGVVVGSALIHAQEARGVEGAVDFIGSLRREMDRR